MPVHLYGQPADMDALGAIAAGHGLALFEDAAQSHGATWGGRPVGSFGTFGMFSLYPTKNMTSGEGGMVSCANDTVANNVRLLRNQGMLKQYANELIGFNARMTDIHAAIGRVQLAKVAGWTKQRQANAAFLSANLAGVVVPAVHPQATHVFHQYTIRVGGDRDRIVAALREEYGVGSGVYYPIPNHRLASLAKFAPGLELPQTEKAAAQVISLPVHPSLTQEDLDRIVSAVNAVVKAGA
jgi:dTDP-4-amino-4,6-dideoxygalactose transaminase